MAAVVEELTSITAEAESCHGDDIVNMSRAHEDVHAELEIDGNFAEADAKDGVMYTFFKAAML